MIVACNKMDDKSVSYAESRYDEIKEELTKTLIQISSMNIPSMEMGVLKRANKLYRVMSAEERRPYEE